MAPQTYAARQAALSEAVSKCEGQRDKVLKKLEDQARAATVKATAELQALQTEAEAETTKIAKALALEELALVDLAEAIVASNGGRQECLAFADEAVACDARSRAMLPVSGDLSVMQRNNRLLWIAAQVAAGDADGGSERLQCYAFVRHASDGFEGSYTPGGSAAGRAEADLWQACRDRSPSRVWRALGALLEICEAVIRESQSVPAHWNTRKRSLILRLGGSPEIVAREMRELQAIENHSIAEVTARNDAIHAARHGWQQKIYNGLATVAEAMRALKVQFGSDAGASLESPGVTWEHLVQPDFAQPDGDSMVKMQPAQLSDVYASASIDPHAAVPSLPGFGPAKVDSSGDLWVGDVANVR